MDGMRKNGLKTIENAKNFAPAARFASGGACGGRNRSGFRAYHPGKSK
jgi:hypothetical protein